MDLLEIISDIGWFALLVVLFIRIRMIEKEVENIKSWEMFTKICVVRFVEGKEEENKALDLAIEALQDPTRDDLGDCNRCRYVISGNSYSIIYRTYQ